LAFPLAIAIPQRKYLKIQNFSKLISIVILHSKSSNVLTFENLT